MKSNPLNKICESLTLNESERIQMDKIVKEIEREVDIESAKWKGRSVDIISDPQRGTIRVKCGFSDKTYSISKESATILTLSEITKGTQVQSGTQCDQRSFIRNSIEYIIRDMK